MSIELRAPPKHTHPDPPGAWPAARAAARRVISPVERFLAVEASSGIVLLAAAAVALLWANSPWSGSYHALWHTPFGLELGPFSFRRDLHFWVNDGLMTIFFFVVGLEIRRELHHGELSELRRAALPLVAAVGGMVTPAAVYAGLNAGTEALRGWGVPMATDIAFAVGVLALLGRRVPPALRILLLALAVIDDLGAILVIALFYSSGLDGTGALIAALGVAAVFGLQKVGARRPALYVPPAIAVWAGVYVMGVHPTLAGVVVGLLTPVRAWFGTRDFETHAQAVVHALRQHGPDIDERLLLPHLERLDMVTREAVSPVERLQHALHGWVAFVVMPVFALANAGVSLGQATLDGAGRSVALGVVLGLVVGKPVGIVGLSWLAVRARLTTLPRGVRWLDVAVVGLVAGIGFTMSIFLASLAFPPGPLLEIAKLAVLASSAIAAVAGLVFGRVVLSARRAEQGAATEAEAEASTAS